MLCGNILSDFKCLLVLKLSGYWIKELSDSIGCLVHLRLLNISWTKIKELPKSITKLYNLQTLRLEGCYDLEKLPGDLKKLVNLRHIYLDFNVYIQRPPKYMGQCTCLQTYKFFKVDKDPVHRIVELGRLNQLSGELNIYNIENVRDEEEAKSANLAERAKINQLRFHWSYNSRIEVNHRNEEEVLEGLHPHQNLKSSTIDGFGGKKFPSWMLTSDATDASSPLVNLIEINLSNCGGVDSYNSNVSFPTLRRLTFSL